MKQFRKRSDCTAVPSACTPGRKCCSHAIVTVNLCLNKFFKSRSWKRHQMDSYGWAVAALKGSSISYQYTSHNYLDLVGIQLNTGNVVNTTVIRTVPILYRLVIGGFNMFQPLSTCPILAIGIHKYPTVKKTQLIWQPNDHPPSICLCSQAVGHRSKELCVNLLCLQLSLPLLPVASDISHG